ncbi:MAG: hypothetical protein M3N18_06280 [Actinomycetota bacterium]|nr:hypothetical protein [Actinomycetota bacterium]
MTKNGLHRHYDRLNADERFRLDVLAMARGDKQESERLVSSCPRFTYTMTDRAFAGRWLGAMDVTLRMYLDIATRLDRLKMIEAVRVVLPYHDTFAREAMLDAFLEGHHAGARQAWRQAGRKGTASEWPLDGLDEAKVDELNRRRPSILSDILDGLERKETTDALTLWRGFEAFCDDRMGLDAAKILRVVLEPAAERIEELETAAERLDLEPDAELVEEIREGLAEAWRLVERRGI